jgi:hypothetical protein
MIAAEAGAHFRGCFVDHDAPARARQRDCRGEARGTRPDNLQRFVADRTAHLPIADMRHVCRPVPNRTCREDQLSFVPTNGRTLLISDDDRSSLGDRIHRRTWEVPRAP